MLKKTTESKPKQIVTERKPTNKVSLRTLRTFVTVAESGTISAAAQKLGRSQAAVSATISDFEALLGIPVFFRKPTKGLVLTPVGEILSLEAKGLLAHSDEFETIAGAMGSALEGELSVACFTNLAPVLAARLISEFSKRYPKIQLRLLVGSHDEILESVRNGVSEIALSFDLGISDQYRSIPIVTLPPLAVLSKNHPLSSASVLSLEDLVDEPMILMDLPHTREYFLSLFYSLNLNPTIRFRSRSFETVRTLVGNGLGYSILNLVPKLHQTYDGSEVVSIPLAEPVRPLRLELITLQRVTQRRIVRTFLDFARGYIRDWGAQAGFELPEKPAAYDAAIKSN